MTTLLIIFGALSLLAGLVIIVNPEIVFGFLRKRTDKPALHILAVVVRLILGALLILQASESRFPSVIGTIGWLSIIAAVILGAIGRRNFIRLMSWALSLVKTLGRFGGFMAVAFGAFLIYAFV